MFFFFFARSTWSLVILSLFIELDSWVLVVGWFLFHSVIVIMLRQKLLESVKKFGNQILFSCINDISNASTT